MGDWRLTKRNEQDTGYYYPMCIEKCSGIGTNSKCDSCELTENVCEKLGKYEDLEEQGLLLELPCPIGAKVYYVQKCLAPSCEARIFEQEFDYRHLKAFGKRTFLTKEEAEKRLRELEEN